MSLRTQATPSDASRTGSPAERSCHRCGMIEVMDFRVDAVLVLLTNRSGRILMQHRTDDAPGDPGLWALPGGGIEPDESPTEAAHRELFEETGLRCPGLTFDRTVIEESGHALPGRFHLFTGTTDASDDDVVLGEGQAMVFLTIEQIWQKDLAPIARTLLPPPRVASD